MISLELRQVYFAYFDGFVLQNIDMLVRAGEMVGLLGPNGSGKTTLLKLASGILKPKQGEIRLDGSILNEWGRKSIARSVAVVPQQFHIPFAFSVAEVVMLGRTPFQRALAEESKDDRQVVFQALELVGMAKFRERLFGELSGGERQKVILAMALAQQPKLLLLDEPTAHLDIAHQIEILELVKRLNGERRLTVMAAMHDLNLAALYFGRLVLFKEGSIVADGTPAQVLTEAQIAAVFAASVSVEPHQRTGVPHIIVLPKGQVDKH